MLNQKEQEIVLSLIKETKALIFREMEAAKVTVKGAADYVTNVDFAVQEFLRKELAEAFPAIRLIAEEKENKDLDRDQTCWILDPIDGTTNLIHHYGQSAVSIGLYEQGEITFGAVYNPFHEELFSAAKGEGAYLNGQPIHVNNEIEMKDAIVSFGSSPYEKDRADSVFPIYLKLFKQCADFRRTGSAALDLCYVACGRQHMYLEQNLKPWDYAGGSVILTEAGGTVKRWNGSSLPWLTNSDVAAATGKLSDGLLEFLQNL